MTSSFYYFEHEERKKNFFCSYFYYRSSDLRKFSILDHVKFLIKFETSRFNIQKEMKIQKILILRQRTRKSVIFLLEHSSMVEKDSMVLVEYQ